MCNVALKTLIFINCLELGQAVAGLQFVLSLFCFKKKEGGWKSCFLQGHYLQGGGAGSQRSNGSLCVILAGGNLGHVQKFQRAGIGRPVNTGLARGLSGTGMFYLLNWLPTSAGGRPAFESTWLLL